jgi:hypothetical protein
MRRRIGGYTDFGSIQIPPRAQPIILTDREDGTLWLVSFNTDDPERLSISDTFSTIQRKDGARVYAADDGPKMDEDGQFTLIVRGGNIGLEFTEFPRAITARDDSPPYARKLSAQRELLVDTLDLETIHLGYNT